MKRYNKVKAGLDDRQKTGRRPVIDNDAAAQFTKDLLLETPELKMDAITGKIFERFGVQISTSWVGRLLRGYNIVLKVPKPPKIPEPPKSPKRPRRQQVTALKAGGIQNEPPCIAQYPLPPPFQCPSFRQDLQHAIAMPPASVPYGAPPTLATLQGLSLTFPTPQGPFVTLTPLLPPLHPVHALHTTNPPPTPSTAPITNPTPQAQDGAPADAFFGILRPASKQSRGASATKQSHPQFRYLANVPSKVKRSLPPTNPSSATPTAAAEVSVSTPPESETGDKHPDAIWKVLNVVELG